MGRWNEVYLLTYVYHADEATLALMKTPRCSLPDLPLGAQARRKRQTPPPTKWSKRNLSWRYVAGVGAPQDSISLSFYHPWGQSSSERIPPVCRLWVEGGACPEMQVWSWRLRVTPGLICIHLLGTRKWQMIRERSCQGRAIFYPRGRSVKASGTAGLYSDPDPRVRTFPRDSPLGRDTVRALMYYALKVWSDITPLNFHEVAGNTADIQIDFSKADHNDGYPFDGPGGTVAHAFFPGDHHTAGDTHFDDDEAWTFRSSGM